MSSCPSTATDNLPREPEKKQQQPVGTLDFLSRSEFPKLGSDVNLTKAQKTKVKDVTVRGDTFPVFKEAYHAQLRKVHGANMRAVEAMEGDGEEHTRRGRYRNMDLDTVNSLMEGVIRDIAAEGELVTEEKVRSTLKLRGIDQHFGKYTRF